MVAPAWTRIVIDDAKLGELGVVGVDTRLLDALRPLANQTFSSRRDYWRALEAQLGPDWQDRVVQVDAQGLELSRKTYGEIVGYLADGWLGQYVIILPASRLVAVRQIQQRPDYNGQTDTPGDFVDLVQSMAGS